MPSPIIYWFRQDLRTRDLPGLLAATATGRPVVACYILDEVSAGEHAPGSASRWWLHHSLESLAAELAGLGGSLVLRRGSAALELDRLIGETGAEAVYCSRLYEPWADRLEAGLHDSLGARGVDFRRYPGALLFEPGKVMNQSGGPFKVFTPFWRHCRAASPPARPRPRPADISWFDGSVDSDTLATWELLPRAPNWAEGWPALWQPGSAGACKRLDLFLAGPVEDYSEGRNHPAKEATSRLSAHLHFGEISPRVVWHAARDLAHRESHSEQQVDKFLSEMGWREFSHHLLYHFPHVDSEPFKPQFREFPWLGDETALRAWQQGQTGYPIVDAGMRELWHTGYMHNRIRMVVASFLTKHLLVHWRAGARWFWDTLVDADLANNSCGWQWVAGSGADASPYFRIFNPVIQGEKFDAQGDYLRRWVPELALLPDRYLNRPWEAPAGVLEKAGVRLGDNYPYPLVDHKSARESALAAYAAIRDSGQQDTALA
ncbi:MAG: deoxyribodipyrimidine photo-lyase [Halieaceae bacterium]|jgi:deoxyribodipyrimidine photo-lyase|nr:deoxyribodipyrimidine photo-lyase [Halieaceae bacterium]